MSQPYQLAYLPYVKQFEGNEPSMYLDSCDPGNVTCGVGFELETAMVAQGFPWYIPGLYTLATAQEVVDEWNRVSAMQPGHLPPYYATLTALRLKQEDIDAHLLAELDRLAEGLAEGIPGFENLPDGWKMALTDIGWNLGLHGLLGGYPKMLAAVQAGNGPVAAAECHRSGINDQRNQWTAACFNGQVADSV